MRIVAGWSWLALSLALVAGCSGDQSVDAGTNQAGRAGSGASDGGAGAAGDAASGAAGEGGAAGASGEPGQGGAAGSAGGKPGTGVVVNVVYGGVSRPVDLGTLPTATVNDQTLASLVDVWNASSTPADLAKVQFDFEGDDGFRPSSKNACKTPITGAQLGQGYIDPVLRNIFWDDSLGLSGCYRVKGVARVLASDAP